ncbi:MAG: TM1266 family iron-only hydrogenase system putative regulator [Acutalibacteraceae bacterium]|nr:TM1266 family iron-only hydrogenase system putative regulator [Acutalibacteraceae bacterium]
MDKEKRIALVGIIIEDTSSVEKMNNILSQFSEYIIGRMGIPYKEKSVSVISVVMDAPNNIISALSGKIGMLTGIQTKTIYSNK